MTRWQLLQELFEETVELEPEQRARVLDVRTGGDAELTRLVEELVASDRTPASELERSGVELLRDLGPEPSPAELCGASFGPYRVEEHLSSGGMGHVYRATRSAAGTERRVALKVLRSRLDLDALLARFQRERQVLAALEHEHVVAFLDAGALPDGRPFLVMEYVDGVPITEWARAKRASRRERIELFLQVAAAVQYAHRMLVVHRDLKPSNVLVTGEGVPKLLDFGVASVVEGEPEAQGRAPLTPSYAAPEELAGSPPTTAGDVYSLGVLLHELLTGELPRDGRPPGLGRDLDAIVAKALEADPARRYLSADRLADDLRRHLDGEPVGARAGNSLYRAACFARRRRWSLLIAAALVAGLVVGWIGSDLERRSAERESARGWGAHAQAKVAARVFEGWIVERAAGDRELGASAVERLEAALREDLGAFAEAETLVRLTLARLYLDRGERARAAEHAERAWELAQTTSGVGPIERQRAAELRALAGEAPR
jgi:predicted Ser/Thr protein kinase